MAINYKWLDSEKKHLEYQFEEVVSCVPADPANTDYQNFLKWCEEGNEPEPYVAPEPGPAPTPEEKLAASGLTVDELKVLLGIN